jgi:uncharacterized protein (DUF1778 family)
MASDRPTRKDVHKDKTIQIRVTEKQKETLTEAAERAGLGVSSWMLSVSLTAAARKTDGDRRT